MTVQLPASDLRGGRGGKNRDVKLAADERSVSEFMLALMNGFVLKHDQRLSVWKPPPAVDRQLSEAFRLMEESLTEPIPED